ncbi:Fc.00g034020.m01.CDS01, partial [Cosmosporella sp. VM-42]
MLLGCFSLGRLLSPEDLSQILDWGIDNKVTFDPDKAELIFFTRVRSDEAPEVTVSENDFSICSSRDLAVCWLGVWFDWKFKFVDKYPARTSSKLPQKGCPDLYAAKSSIQGRGLYEQGSREQQDGSKGLSGAVGWGYVIHRAGEKVAQGKGWLGLAE